MRRNRHPAGDRGPARLDVGFVAGGTGGHVYPALAVAAALVEVAPNTSIEFVVDARPASAQAVRQAGHDPVVLPMRRGWQRSAHPREIIASLLAAVAVLRSFVIALAWVRRRRPRVVAGFGAYVTAPVVVAARLWRIPVVVHEQNGHPGLANRLAVRLGARAAISVPDTPLGRDAVLTGNPVRPEIVGVVRAPQTPPLVAFVGASLGARVLNDVALELADAWRNRDDVALYVVTGPNHYDEVARRYAELRDSGDGLGTRLECTIVAYQHDMAELYSRAALMVTRGGGSVMELAAAAVPAIIVPWSGSAEDHQSANARAAAAAGGAIHIPEPECTRERIGAEIDALLGAPGRLLEMSAAWRTLARPNAAADVAALLLESSRA